MFLTHCDELGLVLNKMYEVLGLPIGEMAYEEYVHTGEELHLLNARQTLIYDTFWEILCHYHICA